jgi:hypothetical protein
MLRWSNLRPAVLFNLLLLNYSERGVASRTDMRSRCGKHGSLCNRTLHLETEAWIAATYSSLAPFGTQRPVLGGYE